MKIKFLQDYEGYKKGDVVETPIAERVWELIRQGIIERYVPKQQKKYNDKMMRNYLNK